MPWPLAFGGTREVDEVDREVVKTAQVVVTEHMEGVVAGTTADSITSRRRSIGSSSRKCRGGGGW